ncbi:MAG: vitamin B12-dependent ribonucleotide reductase [Elusimicrobia bacterium]|nr:vitamin B12-dependent ribonucleotide reductase [Elusimicrobiota bacterium]
MTRRATILERRTPSNSHAAAGLSVLRRWTSPDKDPFDLVEWTRRSSSISDSSGGDVFRMDSVEVPRSWSQLSTDIAASKYLRKTGVPVSGSELGVRQLFERVACTIREAGQSFGYFASKQDAAAFEAELKFMLVHQIGAFNSPVFFNVGLHHRYGIGGTGGNWHWDQKLQAIVQGTSAYEHPQASACFIQSLDDHLPSIFELAKNEARIFKYGSGSGTNFSKIRSKDEKISGGGTASGLMFFLEVLDKGAGAIKSGGVARRAAKMVVLDMDHPEIEDFIQWKCREEKKAAVLIAAGYPSDFNGEAYHTVSGQNSNNSVRLSDPFMHSALSGGKWMTRERTSGKPVKELDARRLLNLVSQAAWACADPGVQFDDTINNWHTCSNTDRIRASNPCSEYMFLDDSACNLASLNLMKFLQDDGGFDVDGFRHAARVFFIAQEILVELSSYPTQRIGQNSHDYRPLGLGYANLGTLLMVSGIPYDSNEGRALCGAITSMLTGKAYAVSAELAKIKGPFNGFAKNRDTMLAVMEKHRVAVSKIDSTCPEALRAAAQEDWDQAVEQGRRWGYRNAQASVLAPTGTIGLLMGCDTTGIEPEFALVKVKKLAGGGTLRIANESVGAALSKLGYSPVQIDAILQHVSREGTIEGAPGLKSEHLPVFDCANPSKAGGRYIEPMGHVRMMAAAQPFISGAISKTVNVPHETTVQEIERIYVESWRLGLKAISVYRDGCKLSQPLNVAAPAPKPEAPAPVANKPLDRKHLPQRRSGFTQELKLGGQKFYLRTGEYEDGRLGEVWLDGGKPGSPLKGMLCAWATTLSLSLQYGVPLEELLDRLTFIKFDPAGPVQHPYVRNATSIIDLAARILSIEYLGRTDLAHVKPPQAKPKSKTKAAKASPVEPVSGKNAMDQHLSSMMGDAPLCDTCGYITVRNGTCYRCLNCGNSMGCS